MNWNSSTAIVLFTKKLSKINVLCTSETILTIVITCHKQTCQKNLLWTQGESLQ